MFPGVSYAAKFEAHLNFIQSMQILCSDFEAKKIGGAPLGCQIGNSKTDLFNTSSPNSESTKISMSKFVQTLTQVGLIGPRLFLLLTLLSHAAHEVHLLKHFCYVHITVTYFVTYLCITLL